MAESTPAGSERPAPLDAKTQQRLQRQCRSHTGVELDLRRRLHREGLRYFVDRGVEGVPRVRPDVIFPRLRVAVFVDGCFWHLCPQHGTSPKNNAEWWAAKLAANASRDRRVTDALTRLGWLVLRFWEHESAETMASTVVEAVRSRRRQRTAS